MYCKFTCSHTIIPYTKKKGERGVVEESKTHTMLELNEKRNTIFLASIWIRRFFSFSFFIL